MILYIFDKDENVIGHLKSEDYQGTVEMNLNDVMSIEFSVDVMSVYKMIDAYYVGHKDIHNKDKFHLYRLLTDETGARDMNYTGVHVFFDEMSFYEPLGEITPRTMSVVDAFNFIFEGSRWKLGTTVGSEQTTVNFYKISRLDAIRKVLGIWNVEFSLELKFVDNKIVERIVNLHEKLGIDTGKRFNYGDKALEVVRETSKAGITTAIIPLGKGEEKFDETGESTGGYGRKIGIEDVVWSKEHGDPLDKPLGQSYLEIPEMTALFGFSDNSPRKRYDDSFSEITDPNILIQRAYEVLVEQSRPLVHFSAKIRESGILQLGDIVYIIRKEYGIYYATRVFKIKIDLVTESIVEVEFGDELVKSQSDRFRAIADKQKGLEDSVGSIGDKITVIEGKLPAILDEVTNFYWNEDGYNYELKAGNEFGLPAGYYSFNEPIDANPTKVIYMGAGKLLISNEKDTNGNWIWTTALTADGIAGESIIANSITANKLSSDVMEKLLLESQEGISLSVKENIDDYFENNPVEVKVEKPFYAYADIDSIVTAIDRPDEVNYEPSNTDYFFDEDITSLIDEHGLDGWKLSYDVKANAETSEWFSVWPYASSKYIFYQIQHPTTLNYEHYEHSILFKDASLGKTTTLGVVFYNTPFSLKNFMLKKVKNITNFSTSWTNQKYQGVYVGYERPTDPNMYEWARIQGEDGTSGSDGVGLEGEPTIQYGKSDDENTLPVEWFDSPIMVEGGLISWTRTVLTYTDGTVTNIDTPVKVPLDGEQGQDGRGIIELQTMYGLSDNKDVEPTEWFAIPPEIKGGDFSWTRVELIFNDGTTEFIKTVTQNADILEVREDGYLYVNGVKTDKKVQGENGYTPYVQDGYWYINGVNTGQKTVGEDGKDASILYRFSNDKSIMSLVDNSHRYVGLYRGTGDVNLASSYVWLDRLDLKVLEDRIKTNESNIAVNKTNIESKVSQTTYTADQTKVNEQFSTITQDMESWEAKFENIGGTNLLKGSKYVRDWLPINLETITETYANVVQEWDTIDATKVVTNAPDSVSTRKAYKRFEVPTLEEGRLYTFTMYVNNIRAYDEKIILEGGLVGEATITAGAKTRIVIQGYATSEKYIDVVLNSYGGGYFASAIVYKAMLEIGNQVNDWTPHPDEIESGSTRITEEGVTVGKSNSDVQTSIMDNGMFIQDTISGEPIAEYTRDGAKTNVLTATDIYSDSIIRRQKNSMDIYVGPSMSGDGSGKDSSNRLDNINRAIDVGLNYAYHLTDYATINIYLKGTINEIVMITGVSGYGNINIIGESGSRLVGAIFVNSCTAQVNIKDLNISLDAPNAVNACVNYHNSTNGNVVGCTLVGQNAGRGLNVTKSKVTVEGTQFFDLSTALIATDLGEIIAIDNKGGTITYPESVTKGGRLILQGTRFLASRAPTPDAFLPLGGWELDNSTGTGGTRPTFAPPTFGNVSKTFYADLATANSSGHEWLKGEARQGTWDRKAHIGIAKFGSKIKDWLAANGGYQGTVTAVITAKRNRSSGGGTVSFKITNPATLTLPAVSRGGSSSATAGTSLTNSITASSNLALKTSTTSTSDYAGYTSVSIKITTMKKV